MTMLGEKDAIVRGIAVRWSTTGAELERLPFSYLTHLTDEGWKITVLVAES